MDDAYWTMREAREALGVSGPKIWRMVRDGEITTYPSPLDKRQKLIRRADVEALLKWKTPNTPAQSQETQ